jgi:AcrR family transcriptional regulator
MARPRSISDEDLLAIAREVFIRDGAGGSTRLIAERAGLSEAGLFKRFSRKADLFLAAMTPSPVDAAAIIGLAAAAPDPRAGLLAITEGALAYFRQVLPMILPLISNPLVGLDGVRAAFGDNPAEQLTAATAGYLAEQTRAGAVQCADPWAAAALLIMGAHTIAQFEAMGLHDHAIGSGDVAAVVDALWCGLRPPDQP